MIKNFIICNNKKRVLPLHIDFCDTSYFHLSIQNDVSDNKK